MLVVDTINMESVKNKVLLKNMLKIFYFKDTIQTLD